jgi:hypothetical protein
MIFPTCESMRARLPEYHDGELPVSAQIAVAAHLQECSLCAGELQRLQLIGQALRDVSASWHPRASDEVAGLKIDVLGRFQGERDEAIGARIGRLFSDAHLVLAGLGATCATILCITTMLAMLHFASPGRADSLAALLQVMSSPGSNENPVPPDLRMALPRAFPDAVMPAMLVKPDEWQGEVVVLTGVLTREGRLVGPELLGATASRGSMDQLLVALAATRFEPARFEGSPVAVNLVWLLAHTTVRGKILTS